MRKNKAMTALLACTLALQAAGGSRAAAPADNTAAKQSLPVKTRSRTQPGKTASNVRTENSITM